MKIFLDTAEIIEIKKALATGVLDGVTTNPSIIAKSGRPFEKTAREIIDLVPGDVSVEVMSPDCAGMVREARELASWGKNAVIKLPATRAGISALSQLSKEGVRINLTMCASQNQALLACKGGAAYVSIIVGRIDAVGINGMEIVRHTAEMIARYDFKSEIIIGSVRTPLHVLQAMDAGAHVVTLPYKVFDQLFDNPLTDNGIAQFEKDWSGVVKRG